MKTPLVGLLVLAVSSIAAEEASDPFAVQINLRESIGNLPSQPISLTAALDEALEFLATAHPRQAEVAEMRLFAEMEVKQVASVLGVSERTVKGDWRLARAWLTRKLRDGSSPEKDS